MKKTLKFLWIAIIAVAMIFSFASCDPGPDDGDDYIPKSYKDYLGFYKYESGTYWETIELTELYFELKDQETDILAFSIYDGDEVDEPVQEGYTTILKLNGKISQLTGYGGTAKGLKQDDLVWVYLYFTEEGKISRTNFSNEANNNDDTKLSKYPSNAETVRIYSKTTKD